MSCLLNLALLGGFRASLGGQPLTSFKTEKARALLAYLAVEADRPHERLALADLLWPHIAEEYALRNLSQTLVRLRQAIRDQEASPPFLRITRQSLQFNRQSHHLLDVTEFETGLTESRKRGDLAQLEAATARYVGEFLAGFDLADSEPFGEWLLFKREYLHRLALDGLSALTAAYLTAGDYGRAQYAASRQLALDAWRESAHRQLLTALAQSGQRAAALLHYETCRRLLLAELGVEPEAETVALYERIRAGTFSDKVKAGVPTVTLSSPHPATRTLHYDWNEAPNLGHFYGREDERVTVQRWLTVENCRLVAITGMGGVGKTALATHLAHGVADHFEVIVWRSLLNAPALAELLPGCLQALAEQPVALPASLNAQFELLLGYLRRRRCLLVLDNLESILQSGAALPAYRPGAEDYGLLLQYVGQTKHASCLLLTSREEPPEVTRLAWGDAPVRLLQLRALSVGAAESLLRDRGLTGFAAPAVEALVQHYSGNALALKLVAETIRDLYGGDVATFLAEETPIFDDIRTVLDEQFRRLSELERELLTWLAIEREPVTVGVLRANLLQPTRQTALLEAVRNLRRRSLIEPHADGFSLQNVVTEYVTDRLIEDVCAELLNADKAIRRHEDKETAGETCFLSAFNRYALLKTQAREAVCQSQVRLILHPIAERLAGQLGQPGLEAMLQQIITVLHIQTRAEGAPASQRGYAAGNILNLLLHMGSDVTGYDFSHLCVWQAFLRGAYLPKLNFAGADLAGTVFTHTFGDIHVLRFGANNELLVAGMNDGRLRVWRMITGELLKECSVYGLKVSRSGWSKDSRLAAVADADHRIHLFDLESGRRLYTLSGPHCSIWQLHFTQDGKRLASGDVSGQVWLWDVETGQLLHVLQCHTAAITALVFAPSGHPLPGEDAQLFASAAVDGAVCLWNLATGELIHTLRDHTDEVAALVFGLGGSILVTGSNDCTVRLWDVRSGHVLQVLHRHTQPVRKLAITSSGHILATCGGDRLVYLWDVQTGEALHALTDHAATVTRLTFSLDDKLLATFDLNESVCVWDVQSGQRLEAYRVHNHEFYAVDLSPDSRLVVGGGGACTVYLWDISSPADAQLVARLPGHTHSIATVAFHPDGQTVASGDNGRTIRLWNVRSHAVQVLNGHINNIASLTFSPDGCRLASCSGDGTICLWAVPGGQKHRVLQGHTNVITACCFNPAGTRGAQWIASCSLDHTVCLWDAETGELIHRMRGHTNAVQHVTFSLDGRRLISSSFDQTLRVWDPRTGQLLATWPTPNTVFGSLAIHPANEVLAGGGQDQRIHFMAINTGRLLGELPGHNHIVDCVKFSRDGQLLVSASRDETIKLWAVDASAGHGTCLQTLRAPGPYVGMNITGATGITEAQRVALKNLGAVET